MVSRDLIFPAFREPTAVLCLYPTYQHGLVGSEERVILQLKNT